MVETMRPSGMSGIDRGMWRVGGFFLALVAASVTAFFKSTILAMLISVLIWLFACWLVFSSVNSVIRWQQARTAWLAGRPVTTRPTPNPWYS